METTSKKINHGQIMNRAHGRAVDKTKMLFLFFHEN